MQNILYISVQKNLILSRHIFCTTPKTIRSRLFIYLSMERQKPKVQHSKFRLTVRDLPTISIWIAAPYRKSLERCVTRGYWNSIKTNSYCTLCLQKCKDASWEVRLLVLSLPLSIIYKLYFFLLIKLRLLQHLQEQKY